MNINEDTIKEVIKLLEDSAEPYDKAAMLLKQAIAQKPRLYKGQPGVFRDASYGTQGLVGILKAIGDLDDARYTSQSGRRWSEFTPDPTLPSYINWIEHDGSNNKRIIMPTICCVAMILKTGAYVATTRDEIVINSHVARYAIIPLPEFFE